MTWQQLLHSLERQSKASGSRSDVLRVLIWPGAILATLLSVSFFGQAPAWITLAAFVALMIVFAVYLIAFVALLITNPDALRSERFQIEKMAIERGIYGNNLVGASEDQPSKAAQIGSASADDTEHSK